MTEVLTLFVLVALSLAFSDMVVTVPHKSFIRRVIIKGWMITVPMLLIVHNFFPFIPGHDDLGYYNWSFITTGSFARDILSLDRFYSAAEQPGYLWVNSLLNHFVGESLLSYKLANLFLFILLIPVWFRIGSAIESDSFGRKISWLLIFAFPLWFYSFFMLKDMSIVLLQNVFLLMVVLLNAKMRLKYLLGLLVVSFITLMFRSPLVLVIVSLLGANFGISVLMSRKQTRVYEKFLILALIPLLIVGVWKFSTNIDILQSIGLFAEGRNIGSYAFSERLEGHFLRTDGSIISFLVKYIVSETAGFHLVNYLNFDPYVLRGMLAVPWIILGVPFFLAGLAKQLSTRNDRMFSFASINKLNFLNNKWLPVVTYILVYALIGYISNDSTRYRMPDIPASMAIALYGWCSFTSNRKVTLFTGWVFIGLIPLLAVIYVT